MKLSEVVGYLNLLESKELDPAYDLITNRLDNIFKTINNLLKEYYSSHPFFKTIKPIDLVDSENWTAYVYIANKYFITEKITVNKMSKPFNNKNITNITPIYDDPIREFTFNYKELSLFTKKQVDINKLAELSYMTVYNNKTNDKYLLHKSMPFLKYIDNGTELCLEENEKYRLVDNKFNWNKLIF